MSDEYPILIQPRFVNDLESAIDYIAADSDEKAREWASGLMAEIATLSKFPSRCRRAYEADSFSRDIRQLLYGKRPGVYRVIFEIKGGAVLVLRLRHGARQPLVGDVSYEEID